MNTQLSYQYRDASNYKNAGSAIFANPDQLDLQEADRRLKAKFDEQKYFIAEQIGLTALFFGGTYEDDHCWHEYCGLEEAPGLTTTDSRTLREFVTQVEAVHQWEEFSPVQRLANIAEVETTEERQFRELLQDAVRAWPQFDYTAEVPLDQKELLVPADVSGADLCEWFCTWRERVRKALGITERMRPPAEDTPPTP